MSRRVRAPKREVLPDPVYGSIVVSKVINQVMQDGKKGTAQEIVYGAFDEIKAKTGQDPMEVFNKAINNLMPMLECKARRVGGANYQGPMEVRPERRQTLAIRWLVMFARKRNERFMYLRLAGELLDACNEQGGAFKRKEEMHRSAEANKAFAHFRW